MFEADFAAASIEQVVADAGISKVTIYNEFGDKLGVFIASVETQCDRLRDRSRIESVKKPDLGSRLTAIGEAVANFYSFSLIVQFECRIAAEIEDESKIGAAFLAAGRHLMRASVAALLAAMNASGEVSINDAKLAAEHFSAMRKGIGYVEHRFGMLQDKTRARKHIDSAVDVFCRAYATD